MPEASEVQLARLEERIKTILNQMESDRERRDNTDRKLDEYNRLLVTINSRLEKVEGSIAEAAPNIKEFMDFKQKLSGAGILGRWLWLAAGTLIGFLYSMRTEIAAWLTRG